MLNGKAKKNTGCLLRHVILYKIINFLPVDLLKILENSYLSPCFFIWKNPGENRGF